MTRNNWLCAALVAGLLAASGCGGGASVGIGGTSNPGPPVLTMFNSRVDFGDVAVGATTTQGVTFSNTGESPLTLQQNSLSGAGYTTNGIGQGVTLAPGRYVTLAVNFQPSGTGNSNGMASPMSNTSSSPIDLPLSGNGVVAAHSTTLDWDASVSAVVGYNIYRTPAFFESWTNLHSSPVIATF